MEIKEKWLVWGLFSVFVFSLLTITGTLFSGIHFVDDHEMISYAIQIKEDGFWNCVWNTVVNDLDIRFRPLYSFLRVCIVAVIGYNYDAWAILTAAVIVIVLSMGYFCARELGCSVFYSIIFPLVIMVGPQSVVWWKFGPQESIGMAMVMTGIWFLLCWSKKGNFIYGFVGEIFFILVSLYKESFICLLPMAVAIVFFEYWRKENYRIKAIGGWVKKYWIFYLSLALVCIIEGALILLAIGTNEIGYVGLNTEMGLYEYITVWTDCFKGPLKWYVLFGLVILAVMFTGVKSWKEWMNGAIITMAIMLPQVFIYNMTGFSERYILPWALGYAWFLIITLMRDNGVLEGSKIRRGIVGFCLLGLLFFHFIVLWQEAEYHTYRGVNFQKVWEIVEENTDEDSKILSAFTYLEASMTVTLWGEVKNRSNIYTWDDESKTCVKTNWDGSTIEGDIAELDDMEIIMWYSSEHRHYAYEPELNLEEYEVYHIGTIKVAVQKKLDEYRL